MFKNKKPIFSLSLLSVLLVFVLTVSFSAQEAFADTIPLTGTIRDFCKPAITTTTNPLGPCSAHPDFEATIGGVKTGQVASDLGLDKKPVFTLPAQTGFSNAANFNQWYNDVGGVNTKKQHSINLVNTATNPSLYKFLSNSFFPIDGQLFKNQGRNHNFHYTYEIHTSFAYQTGQTLLIKGDDDVWVFINGKKVIDLGGIHPSATSPTVNLNTLGLTAGNLYDFDLFFAERHTTSSVLQIDTTIKFDKTPPVITPTVSGTLGNNGWHVSDVNVSWLVTDLESKIRSTSGCDATNITSDTTGTTFTCNATSDGGSASQSVTIKRDATPPVITLNGVNPLALENNGEPYIDAGAASSDGPFGSGVSGSILVGGTVDTGTVGSYDVTFDVSDNAGNSAVQVQRNVSVIDFEFTTPSYIIGETDSERDYFSIVDTAPEAGPVNARIYASAGAPLDDANGFDVVLSDVGGSRYVSPSILFTSGVTDADNNKLHVESGFRIFVNYRDVISDPPGVAASELAAGGAGSPPSPTDTVQFDSDAFRVETSTNVKIIDPTASGSVSVTIDNVNSASTSDTFSLTLNESPAGSHIFASPYPVLLSNTLGSSSVATAPILYVNVGDVVTATYGSNSAIATIIPTPVELVLNAAGQPVFGTKPDCVANFLNSDTDSDGWCNFMETNTGLQVRLTSTTSAVVYTYPCSRLLDAPGAPTDNTNPVTCPSPTVKDIYVEVDYMTNHKPDYNALLDVINYFRTLPTPIMLHIQVDEDIGFHTNVMPYQKVLAPSTPYSVQAQKEIHFGTVTDRIGSDAGDSLLLTGKRQGFHWALFTHQLTEFPQSSGYSEIWGNDFAVSLGAFKNKVGTRDQQAASFLHELGHNLNLKHDAGVTTNGAPNWISVMNYAMQFPQESGGFIPKANWRLAYSSYKFNTLYETNLAETVAGGITGTSSPPNLYTVVGPAGGGTPFVVQTNTAVNWNGGSTGGTGISLSVHTFPTLGLTSTTPITLTSQNDITSMSLSFKKSGNFATGLSTVPHEDIDAALLNPENDPPADTSDPAVGAVASVGPFDEGVNTGDIGLGTISDYDSTNLYIDVDWGDGTSVEQIEISGLDPDEENHIGVFDIRGDHTYPDNGVYDITISVTNNREPEPTPTPVIVSIQDVVVNNVAPVITSVINNGPVNVGSSATITVTATDVPADTISYSFDCGNDGTFEIGPQASNSALCLATSAPSLTVGVRASDEDGGVSPTSTTIVIVVSSLLLGNFISPIDNTNYNDDRTLPVKITVTNAQGQIVTNAKLFVLLDGNAANCKNSSGGKMKFNAGGQFYECSLKFPEHISDGLHTVKVTLAGGDPPSRSVTIRVS